MRTFIPVGDSIRSVSLAFFLDGKNPAASCFSWFRGCVDPGCCLQVSQSLARGLSVCWPRGGEPCLLPLYSRLNSSLESSDPTEMQSPLLPSELLTSCAALVSLRESKPSIWDSVSISSALSVIGTHFLGSESRRGVDLRCSSVQVKAPRHSGQLYFTHRLVLGLPLIKHTSLSSWGVVLSSIWIVSDGEGECSQEGESCRQHCFWKGI